MSPSEPLESPDAAGRRAPVVVPARVWFSRDGARRRARPARCLPHRALARGRRHAADHRGRGLRRCRRPGLPRVPRPHRPQRGDVRGARPPVRLPPPRPAPLPQHRHRAHRQPVGRPAARGRDRRRRRPGAASGARPSASSTPSASSPAAPPGWPSRSGSTCAPTAPTSRRRAATSCCTATRCVAQPTHKTGPRVGVSGSGGEGTRFPWRYWLTDERTVSAYRPAYRAPASVDVP